MPKPLLCALAALVLLCLSGPVHAEPPACAVPPDLALTDLALPTAKKAVATRHGLTIVTLGGASTAGMGGGGREHAYPAQLEAILRERMPGITVNVINRGAPAMSVRDRIDRIGTDLSGAKADLVIWAPGSTEAGAAEDPDRFRASLAEGVSRIRSEGADLLLIDLQYTPMIAKAINLAPYNAAIARIAHQEHAGMLPRSALMQRWQESGALELDGTPRGGRVAAIRHLFTCVAMALADGIVPAIQTRNTP